MSGGDRQDLTRFLLLRGMGCIWFVTFLIWWRQAPLLVGSRGLTPAADFLVRVAARHGDDAFSVLPTLFWFDDRDAAIALVGAAGTLLGAAVALGLTNAAVNALLWVLYVSLVNVGQDWYGFGWEMLMCEVSFLAIFLAPLGSLSPRGLPPPNPAMPWLFRWLVFRLMLGAGLIKLRGDPCWVELTCLVTHYETQPNPHPLSWFFHHLPVPLHQLGALYNHLVELVLPWFVFGPRRARRLAGAGMLVFQLLLIASGNLAFFNWLTLVLVLAVLDDGVFERLSPRLRGWLRPAPAPTGGPTVRRWAVAIALTTLVAWRSVPVVDNLFFAERQAMNRGYDPVHLVNTYGAFGSVGQVREEIVLQGTADDPTDPGARWLDYGFPCKPGDPMRRPCFIAPWHLHLDWHLWFVPLQGLDAHPWIAHLVAMLLRNEPLATEALAHNPFEDTPPRAVRGARYSYRFTEPGEEGWWRREAKGLYIRPLTADDPQLRRVLERNGWR
jgi:hypothetical protein